MDFKEAEKFLDQLDSFQKKKSKEQGEHKFSLKPLKNFLSFLELDFSKVYFINVAGSKGKGTVSNFIYSSLVKNKKNVALFTSPFMISVREMIQVNGRQISEQKFADSVLFLKNKLEESGIFLSYFEFVFVIAINFFLDQKCNYVVLEAGLGALFDVTNVVDANKAVLTRVEKEHVNVLGNSYEEILTHKLGHVREGRSLVVGLQKPEVKSLILKMVDDERVKLNFVKSLEVRSLALDQDLAFLENAALAKKVLFEIDPNLEVLDKDFLKFRMLGRMEKKKVNGNEFIFDMAHTPSSIENLTNFLKSERFADYKIKVLFSVLDDKDVKKILLILSSLTDNLYYTKTSSSRCLDLKEENCFGLKVKQFFENHLEAFNEIVNSMEQKKEILVVTGSHYLISDLYRKIKF